MPWIGLRSVLSMTMNCLVGRSARSCRRRRAPRCRGHPVRRRGARRAACRESAPRMSQRDRHTGVERERTVHGQDARTVVTGRDGAARRSHAGRPTPLPPSETALGTCVCSSAGPVDDERSRADDGGARVAVPLRRTSLPAPSFVGRTEPRPPGPATRVPPLATVTGRLRDRRRDRPVMPTIWFVPVTVCVIACGETLIGAPTM